MQNHITRQERELLNIFRQLNADGRRTLTARAGELLELKQYTQTAGAVVKFRPPSSSV